MNYLSLSDWSWVALPGGTLLVRFVEAMTASHEKSILGMLLVVGRAFPLPLLVSLMAFAWLIVVLPLVPIRQVLRLSLSVCQPTACLVVLLLLLVRRLHILSYT